jgi:hypothetical protein
LRGRGTQERKPFLEAGNGGLSPTWTAAGIEVADLQLAAFLDENDLEIEIRIKIVALLQLFYADSLCRCYLSSSCGDSSVWIWPRKLARRISAGINQALPDGKHGVHRAELFLCCAGSKRRDQSKTRAAFWARGVPCAASTYCIK